MTLPDIDLPKVANVAGSAVALVIATAIFLSWITARYVPAFDRYRALTGEFRGIKEDCHRATSLREQIQDYRRRLRYMSRTTELLCVVMVCAILTIVLASSSVLFPPKDKITPSEEGWLKVVTLSGSITLLAALALDIVAIGFIVAENRIDRRAIELEVLDIQEKENEIEKKCPGSNANQSSAPSAIPV